MLRRVVNAVNAKKFLGKDLNNNGLKAGDVYIYDGTEFIAGPRLTAWTPGFSTNGVTWTGAATYAEYYQIGEILHYSIGASDTLSGSGSSQLRFDTPSGIEIKDSGSARGVGAGYLLDNGTQSGAVCKIVDDNTIAVEKADGSNWGTTGTGEFYVEGWFGVKDHVGGEAMGPLGGVYS